MPDPRTFTCHLVKVIITNYCTHREEHLTAEEMENRLSGSEHLVCRQAHHFTTLALGHYNSTKKAVCCQLPKILVTYIWRQNQQFFFVLKIRPLIRLISDVGRKAGSRDDCDLFKLTE